MLFKQALPIYDSRDGNPFEPLNHPAVKDGRFDNAITVNRYCAWLVQMGADFEVRYDTELGYLLLKSNVQDTRHAYTPDEEPEPQPEEPVAPTRRGGIRKRTFI